MARILIKQIGTNKMYHHIGTTRYVGCQCFKDCTCREDFTPRPYDYYTIRRIAKSGKMKTIHETTLEKITRVWDSLIQSIPQPKH